MAARFSILILRLLSYLPLGVLRALGLGLGYCIYALAAQRRHIVQTNLRLCLPELSASERQKMVRHHFVLFAQSWLDRAWLWHSSSAQLAQRLRWTGDTAPIRTNKATIVFSPHFVGLDAGGTALCAAQWRTIAGIYTIQSNAVIDQWVLDRRSRFNNLFMINRSQSARAIITAVREKNAALYLLPDMDLGERESLFVPFFSVSTATTPALSRMARLTGAQVVPMITILRPYGYECRVFAPMEQFPTADVEQDTRRANAWIEQCIREYGIEQYYWVHKRFKTRPPGAPSVY